VQLASKDSLTKTQLRNIENGKWQTCQGGVGATGAKIFIILMDQLINRATVI
jgi:hypothetical protein